MLRTRDWPTNAASLAEGRRFVLCAAGAKRVALAPDRDVDGLSAAVLMMRALERLGAPEIIPVLPGKGEHVHTETMRARIRSVQPDALIVLDMGSREPAIVAGLPTLVVDHHRPTGRPHGSILVNGHAVEPVAPTSLLTWHLLAPLTNLSDLDWVAALGTVGDLGAQAPFDEIPTWLHRHGRTNVTRAVALVNAARRSPAHDVGTALQVLLRARSPAEIAKGLTPGVERLRRYQAEVKAELDRCARTAPVFAGRHVLIRCSSPAQIHPLLAARWARRLRDYVVIAANDGYLPGRVNFAMRNHVSVDMLVLLRGLDLGPVTGEYGFGHPAATGGSLAPEDFDRLLVLLGFAARAPEQHSPPP